MTYQWISKENPLILASASPRRKRLLEQVGLPFRMVPGHVDENQSAPKPSFHARLLAEAKARAACRILKNHWTLGADTIVVLGDAVLGKPQDDQEAEAMLSALSGKEHEVITAFSILNPDGGVGHAQEVSTRVRMKPLHMSEIKAYIATGEPFGKAGSYAIQGIGAFMVEAIQGSYSNVVGLPLCALIQALLETGAIERFPLSGGDAAYGS